MVIIMYFLEQTVVSLILLSYPILIYLIYVASNNNLNRNKNLVLLDVACLTSFYMFTKYTISNDNSIYLFLFINVPLIITILNKRYTTSIIISLAIISYYYLVYKINIPFLILEYAIYNIIFLIIKYNKKDYLSILNIFCFVKGIILSILAIYIFPNDNNIFVIITKLFVILITFYFLCYSMLKLVDSIENIISLNYSFKDLEKEKTLKNALFQIVHEVKNPLAVCKGYLSMMEYNNIDKVKQYNSIIQKEVDRTLCLMEDFNDYTKIKINKDIIDIVLLVQETIDSMKTIMNKESITIKSRFPTDEVYIEADYLRLKQVFINLLKNAMEAIKEKGKIEIEMKCVDKNVMIKITDNGEGMDEETLKKIGTMFYTTKEHGTGIGVALSYEIIKQHNGIIEYSSNKKKGTEVKILLPKSET